MKKPLSILLTFVFILAFAVPAYASPDPTWASFPVQKQGGSTNETKYTKAVQRLMMNFDRTARDFIYDEDLAGHGIDGSFGPNTHQAVRHYQSEVGLTVDGSVGPATWASLRSNAITYSYSNTDFNYFISPLSTDGNTSISIRQGRSTGNWGSRPWGVTGLTSSTPWNVFNS